jgi:hypothetical protein
MFLSGPTSDLAWIPAKTCGNDELGSAIFLMQELRHALITRLHRPRASFWVEIADKAAGFKFFDDRIINKRIGVSSSGFGIFRGKKLQHCFDTFDGRIRYLFILVRCIDIVRRCEKLFAGAIAAQLFLKPRRFHSYSF